LADLKEKRGAWKLKEESLDRSVWGIRFGKGYGPVVWQTAKWKNGTWWRWQVMQLFN